MTTAPTTAWLLAALVVMSAAAAEREVLIDGPGGKLAGTLVIPDGATAPVAAVVFVTGSGPQDRDETVFGRKPFAQIADALAAAGIASLRCDDRGVAQSTGDRSVATTYDFANDAKAQLAWLRSQPGIDPHRVGVLGHSEGGLIGALLAGAPDGGVDFAVLLAPTCLKGREVLTGQTEDFYRAAGLEPVTSAAAIQRHRELLDVMESGVEGPPLEAAISALMAAQAELKCASPTPACEEIAKTLATRPPPPQDPWTRCFIGLDPRPRYASCQVPTLAMFGDKDTQVSPATNVPALEAAIKSAPVKPEIVVFAGLNHMFQRCTTGLPEEYETIKTGVEGEVLAKMTEWIKARGVSTAPSH